MFECKACEAKDDEIRFLREQNKALTDKVTAIADIRAFEAVKFDRSDTDYYGSSPDDCYVGYDDMGRSVLMKKAD